MTKKEIVKRISEEIGLTQLQTKDIVQRTLDAIIRTLVTDGRIELRNFGVFEVKRRAPRKARNPRTGETLIAPARNVVTFKPGKEMEEQVGSMVVEGNAQDDRDIAKEQPAPPRSPKSSPKPKKQASSKTGVTRGCCPNPMRCPGTARFANRATSPPGLRRHEPGDGSERCPDLRRQSPGQAARAAMTLMPSPRVAARLRTNPPSRCRWARPATPAVIGVDRDLLAGRTSVLPLRAGGRRDAPLLDPLGLGWASRRGRLRFVPSRSGRLACWFAA